MFDKAVCEAMMPGEGSSGQGWEGPRHHWYVPVKVSVEWIAALLMLLIAAPLVGLLSALVKLTSPGPAFYSQVRLGRDGRPFQIYKLRSMSHNCEAKTGAVWSQGSADPRVTRIGRMLRDTHFDELPQLWNVVRGDMSLIGPRPERPEIASKLERALPTYGKRLLVKPGVTGLAQVELPPDVDLESVRRKLAYDLHYIHEVNPVMDLKILFATFLQVTGAGIAAIGRGVVKTERSVVESQNFGGLKLAARDTWRVGAA